MKKLIFLAEVDSFQQLCSSGIIGDILERFNKILVDNNHYLQPLLLQLIKNIGVNHIELTELREYFKLMQDEKFPPNILSSLVSIAATDISPCYHVELKQKNVRMSNLFIPATHNS